MRTFKEYIKESCEMSKHTDDQLLDLYTALKDMDMSQGQVKHHKDLVMAEIKKRKLDTGEDALIAPPKLVGRND